MDEHKKAFISTKPKISFIIPAYREEKFITTCLTSVLNQSFKEFELIVVVKPSTDRTEEIARKYANKLIIQRGTGVGDARNLGASVAEGDILVFMDADTIIPPDFLEKLLSFFKKGAISITPKFYVYDQSLRGAFVQSALNILLKLVNKVKFIFYGMLFAIRKDLFLQIGGFSNVFGEDIDFAFKISRKYRINRGRIIKYCPSLIAYTSSRRINELGIWRGLRLWIMNLIRRWILKKEFVGYR